nr:MAG TPA: hypothetical protein [Caudoviricetes sp.]
MCKLPPSALRCSRLMGDGHSPTVSEGKIHSSRAAKKEYSDGISFGRLVSPELLSLPLVSSSNLITFK